MVERIASQLDPLLKSQRNRSTLKGQSPGNTTVLNSGTDRAGNDLSNNMILYYIIGLLALLVCVLTIISYCFCISGRKGQELDPPNRDSKYKEEEIYETPEIGFGTVVQESGPISHYPSG